jgi:hypothetical protein
LDGSGLGLFGWVGDPGGTFGLVFGGGTVSEAVFERDAGSRIIGERRSID